MLEPLTYDACAPAKLRGIQRRRRHHELQLAMAPPPNPASPRLPCPRSHDVAHQAEQYVGLQGALVGLVEYNDVIVLQLRVEEALAQKTSVGEETNSGAIVSAIVESKHACCFF